MHEEMIPARIKVEFLSCCFPRNKYKVEWLPVVSLHEFIGVVPFGNDADVTIVVDTLVSTQAIAVSVFVFCL